MAMSRMEIFVEHARRLDHRLAGVERRAQHERTTPKRREAMKQIDHSLRIERADRRRKWPVSRLRTKEIAFQSSEAACYLKPLCPSRLVVNPVAPWRPGRTARFAQQASMAGWPARPAGRAGSAGTRGHTVRAHLLVCRVQEMNPHGVVNSKRMAHFNGSSAWPIRPGACRFPRQGRESGDRLPAPCRRRAQRAPRHFP